MDESQLDPKLTPDSSDELAGSGEQAVTFEELTLAEALGYLLRQPLAVARDAWAVLLRDQARARDRARADRGGDLVRERVFVVRAARGEETDQAVSDAGADSGMHQWPARHRARWILALSFVALLMAMRGGILLRRAALDPAMHREKDPGSSLTWLAAAILLALGVELWAVYGARLRGGHLRDRVRGPFSVGALLAAPFKAKQRESSAEQPDTQALLLHPASKPQAQATEWQMGGVWGWVQAHIGQLVLLPLALLASGLAFALNVRTGGNGQVVDVVLTGGGTAAWALSVIGWLLVLADVRRLRGWLEGKRRRVAGARATWVLPALAAITGIAALIRLTDLRAVPPEMTSDHIEKLLDALRVHEGYYAVFFPNNGGREAFQMYVVALVAQLPGVGFSFEALKLATVIEGVITIPVLWWMARQVFGTASARDRRTGQWVGLALAGLVAISSWHLMLSRLGLRIVLTPLTTALVIGLLARIMRGAVRGDDRLRDHLALGVMLGAGVYFYQANRMLPLVVAAGAGFAALAILLRARRGAGRMIVEVAVLIAAAGLPVLAYTGLASLVRGSLGDRLADLLPLVVMAWWAALALAARDRRAPLLRMGGGLLAASVMALALMLPMIRYSQVQPDVFWNRTRGRMFGEEAFVRLNTESGQLETYEPTLREQLERFWDSREVFVDNYADALRMWHWEGDSGWITNPGAYPALDGPTGGLLVLGAALWVAWALRRRDPVFALIPAAALVMLLPSAMTLAYTIENPSFTRASGALPPLFLMAALPLGVVAARLAGWRGAHLTVRGRRWLVSGALAILLIAGVLWAAWGADRKVFFDDYRRQYASSWRPYHAIAAPLRAFAEGEGSYGNAFMVAFPHWLDHRILGTVAGDIRWPNGLVTRDLLPVQIAQNAGTPYAYDPGKPLFVMFHAEDRETADWLRAWYPGGELDLYQYTVEELTTTRTAEFYIYLAPAGSAE